MYSESDSVHMNVNRHAHSEVSVNSLQLKVKVCITVKQVNNNQIIKNEINIYVKSYIITKIIEWSIGF